MTPIPVRNFYYLLCYAWDKLAESRVVSLGKSDYDHIVNLFARVLAGGLEHLLKRGLDQGYCEHQEVFAGVRGKIDFAASVKGHLFPLGRAACIFEELTHDVLHNRILKRTCLNLLGADELARELRDAVRICIARMTEVSDIRLDGTAFGRVQLHRNNGFYEFLLRVCRLIHDASVIDPATGRLRFKDFERDDRAMAGLYERFLLNFYRREQKTFHSRSEYIHWGDTSGEQADLECLPLMRTDVSLEGNDRKIVIDAKYYREPTQSRFGKDTVRSGHLYQLFAYLKNLECLGGVNRHVEGVLIYPLVDKPLDLRFAVHGHSVRVVTIDLSADWHHVHDFLLKLVAAQP